jgi:hypothetical protein
MDDVIICYSDGSQSKTAKMLRTAFIIQLSSFMAFAIQFNNKIRGRAVKIEDVRFHRMLSPKLQTTKLSATKDRPQFLFRVRRVAPEIDRAGAGLISNTL